MIEPVSIRSQAIVFLGLLGIAAFGWLARNQIGTAIAFVARQDTVRSQPQEGRRRAHDSRAVPVIVAPIAMIKSDESLTAIGTARARRHVMLRPRADGQLIALLPKAGDRIASGQLVFQLETTQAELAVKLAENRLEDAQRLLGRQQQLQQRRVTSSARVTDHRMAVEQAKLELRQKQRTLQDLSISAPFSGIVGLPAVEVGEWLTTDTDVMTLDDRRELLVEFKVPERYTTRIQHGDTLQIETPALPGQRFTGRVASIDSRVETASRTMKIRGIIPNDLDVLRPGMSFAVEMVLKGRSHPAVPELALQWRKGESFIWVVRDRQAHKVQVAIVQRQANRVLIEGPVRPDELVVFEGIQRLREGRAISFETPENEQRRPPA